MTSAPLDILLYTHSFAGGGAERVVVQLANHWASRGRRIGVAVNLGEGPLRDELAPEVTVDVLNRPRGLAAGPALAGVLRRRRPRAFASAMTVQNIVAAATGRLAGRGARVLVTEHAHLTAVTAQEPPLRRALLRGLVRLCYPLADVVSAVSRDSARDLDRRLGRAEGTTAVLYNPIWPFRITPGLAPTEVHPWFGGPEPVLLNAARQAPAKDHRNLLDAFAAARRTRPLKLVLIGEGPLRADLEAQAAALGVAEHVDFAGFRRNVGDFLAHADLFVLSSDNEGLPLVLLEALKSGLPVVSTDCPSGPREILEDGRYGALVPVHDPEALARAILDALDAPHDRDALRARAEGFEIDSVAAAYEALLLPETAAGRPT